MQADKVNSPLHPHARKKKGRRVHLQRNLFALKNTASTDSHLKLTLPSPFSLASAVARSTCFGDKVMPVTSLLDSFLAR
jgi:hypothetical protein